MKYKVEKRILECAKANTPILVDICMNWMNAEKESGRNKTVIVNPVTCVFRLHRQRLIAFVIMILSEIASLGIYFLCFAEDLSDMTMSNYLIVAFLSEPISLPFWPHILLHWHDHDSYVLLNAYEFIEAIDLVEGWTSSEFASWRIPHTSNLVKQALTNEAAIIHQIRPFPWREKEVDMQFDTWKRRQMLLRCLFSTLPKDYAEYFPKLPAETSPMKAETTEEVPSNS